MAKKGSTRWQVPDLSSWMHAWNTFAVTRIQIAPQTTLELVKYQHIICQLFSAYPTAMALRYDKLFWPATVMDRLHNLLWDVLKEDVLVWCYTSALLCMAKASSKQAHRHTCSQCSRWLHAGQNICQCFNLGSCNKGAEY